MAYRRKHTTSTSSPFFDDSIAPIPPPPPPPPDDASPTSLAAQAMRASSAHRDSSLSTAYGESAYRESANRQRYSQSKQESKPHEYTSMKSLNESKYGFWSAFTRKAKSVLDDNVAQQSETPGKTRHQVLETSRADQLHQTYKSPESYQKRESPKIQKGFGAITSSLNYIGGTIGNALEEGLTIVESKTADIISETRKLHIRRKGSDLDTRNQTKSTTLRQPPQMQTDHETQLKASRDVRLPWQWQPKPSCFCES